MDVSILGSSVIVFSECCAESWQKRLEVRNSWELIARLDSGQNQSHLCRGLLEAEFGVSGLQFNANFIRIARSLDLQIWGLRVVMLVTIRNFHYSVENIFCFHAWNLNSGGNHHRSSPRLAPMLLGIGSAHANSTSNPAGSRIQLGP